MNSDGAKMPPEPPMPMVRLVGDDLRRRQQDQEPQPVAARHGLVHDRVADPVHLRDSQQEQSQGKPAGGGPGPFRAASPPPVAQVLGQVEDLG